MRTTFQSTFWIIVAATVWELSPAVASLHSPDTAEGLVLEKVRQGSPGDLAGLEVGDVLLSWKREASPPANPHQEQGDLSSPFTLDYLLIEQAPRGRVTLQGKRGDQDRSWTLSSGIPASAKHLEAAPRFTGEVLGEYLRGKTAMAAGALDAGLAAWRLAAEAAEAAGRSRWVLWLRLQSARELSDVYRWTEASAIYAEIVPPLESGQEGDFLAAHLLREWGLLFRERKLWDHADECFQRALTVDRRAGEDTLSIAQSLQEIGYSDNLSGGSKDFDFFLKAALEIRQRLAPESAEMASTWLVWGNGAFLDDLPGLALKRFRKALALQEKLPASPLLRLEVLHSLAIVHDYRGEWERADRIWKEALVLAERVAPEDFLAAGVIHGAGVTAGDAKDFARAEELLLRAHALYESVAPGHINRADVLRDLGRVFLKAGRPAAAVDPLCRGMDIVEVWRRRYEHIEDVRSRWSRFFARYYYECAEARVGAGEGPKAFHAAELGRARAFLNRVSERRRRPSDLTQTEADRLQRLDGEHERTTEALAQAEEGTAEAASEIRNLLGWQREIQRKKEELLAPSEPVAYPDPLTLAEARSHLDEGTVLLFYLVGEKKTLLFVLESEEGARPAGASGWEVFVLPIERSALERQIRDFRKVLIDDRRAQKVIRAQGKRLYDLLLRPAEAYLGRSKRLLVSADGPLHVLPFSALVRDGAYLIEGKPLHFTLSSTVYATLKTRPAADRSRNRIVAFGDPIYPQASARRFRTPSDPFLDKVIRRGLAPLPASREEALSIAGLFPEGLAFTREQATKAKVEEVAGASEILHFAVHGLLNEKAPLDSALALTFSAEPGEAGGGFLRAREVMQNLSLEADLVTLSACDSALGQEVRGEGLIGLTRAFQYAGARSVLAALWGIGDSSTADLMPRFYRELRAGRPKDEALRAAQLGLLGSRKSAPFYWAAFQIFGPWD